MPTQRNPWPALGALVVGFFMILLDVTIVAVANPAIMTDLHADISAVIWVTSAYLLTYAVPLLITGRLGDRFGPKNVYLAGLVVFTLASLWCGLAGDIETLIAARAVQGLGAALMTPQTMAVITRTFPPEGRGAAMGLWGAVAGLATLVGPILGGVLVDGLGWEWIFIVNVPVGVLAFVLAVWLVPALPTHQHKFDWLGVVLSAIGMFLLVFGIQEGNANDWSAKIWLMIVAGIAVLAVFILTQARGTGEPLVPLGLFRDRNFSLSNLAIASMGASVTAVMVPLYFYLQAVHGMTPTRSALVLAPMAIITGFAAPVVGKLYGRFPPRLFPTIGFLLFSASVAWFALVMRDPHANITWLVVAGGVAGLSNSFIWAPLATTATHNLPIPQAGAGAGIYNTTRQVGSVLGSAAISALVAARMSAQGLGGAPAGEGMGTEQVPEPVRQAFSTALSQSTYLPAALLLIGMVASALFLRNPKPAPAGPADAPKADSLTR
ncbi:MDR family MFS transporter [Nocardia carnea]|uniref:MDR family MFS transporter n=1 Tax=Nocardia carnea TaxID=37328 RepID=UPI002456BCAF|nr:MDR family MFS transporter [Nocardia carnea]